MLTDSSVPTPVNGWNWSAEDNEGWLRFVEEEVNRRREIQAARLAGYEEGQREGVMMSAATRNFLKRQYEQVSGKRQEASTGNGKRKK